ncbi:unnamed protein product, partial [Mesorhabditis belari]|uniref:Uncharacterized protein n=1 Tax=Mesorhabditis belari TaxID=2138241 RepID=A0AAF3FIP9_9BILA
MFKFQLLMGIFCLKGLYGAQTINLTELDSTWVVSGYQTKLLSPITILSGAYYSVQFMSSGNYGAFAIFTAMPSLYASPTISLRPTNQVKAGCEHLVYQGGYPAAAGANRYLIHTFNSANTGPASSLSFIPSYSATISVPPNCPISIDAADYSKDYSVFANQSVYFNILVDQFFDGQAGTPQLKLSFDNQVGYILNKTTTGFSQNRNASSFRVN